MHVVYGISFLREKNVIISFYYFGAIPTVYIPSNTICAHNKNIDTKCSAD